MCPIVPNSELVISHIYSHAIKGKPDHAGGKVPGALAKRRVLENKSERANNTVEENYLIAPSHSTRTMI